MDADAERLTEIIGQFLRTAMREAVLPEGGFDSVDGRDVTVADRAGIELA